MIVVGVDPGGHGAIAFLNDEGRLLEVLDMPVFKIKVGDKERTRVSAPGVVNILETWVAPGVTVHLIQETLVAMPGFDRATGARTRPMAANSMIAFGRCGGIVEAAAAALDITYTEVPAGTWKKAIQCPTGKDGARLLAQRTFPNMVDRFQRKKDDGRAESALLALYGLRRLKGFPHMQLRPSAVSR